MKRRHLVQALPLALIGGCSKGTASGSPELFPSRQYTEFNDWLNDARAVATNLIQKGQARDPSRVVQLLALWVVAMPRFVVREWQEITGANAKFETARLAQGSPFAVSAFRMGPGCLQPVHSHPAAGGITVCHEGSLAIKHFDLMPGSAEYTNTGEGAEVGEVSISHVHSGRFTTFTPSAANLHQLEAGPEGAVGVDVLVRWNPGADLVYMKLQNAIATSEGTIGARHLGAWAGLDISKAYS